MSKVNKGSKLFKGIGQRLRADGSMENDSLSRAVEKKKEAMKPQDFTKDFDRIRKMKNSEAFVRKMEKVEQELNAGRLKRDTERIGKNITKSEVNQLYSKLEERKRQRRLKRIVETIPENFYLVDSLDKMDEMVSVMNKSIEGKKVSGFDIETFNPKGSALDMTEGKVAGFSWSWRGHNYYVPLNHVEETGLPDHVEVMSRLKPTLERLYTVMHNAKFDCKWLLWHYDIDMANNLVADTNVMAFMLDDEAPSHSLKTLTIEWLGKEADYFDQLFPNVNRFDEVPLDIATYYAAGDTEKTLELYHYIEKVWRDERYGLGDVRKLFYEVELPVIKQFVYSDVYGINLDTERALELYDELEENIKDIKRRIEEMYGQEINLNSPSQISKMLYDDFELPDITKGWNREKSTDKKALNALKDHHPVVPLIIKHRSESKLQSSYTKSLADKAVNGKVHPDHNTLGARTGRFTCSNPK